MQKLYLGGELSPWESNQQHNNLLAILSTQRNRHLQNNKQAVSIRKSSRKYQYSANNLKAQKKLSIPFRSAVNQVGKSLEKQRRLENIKILLQDSVKKKQNKKKFTLNFFKTQTNQKAIKDQPNSIKKSFLASKSNFRAPEKEQRITRNRCYTVYT